MQRQDSSYPELSDSKKILRISKKIQKLRRFLVCPQPPNLFYLSRWHHYFLTLLISLTSHVQYTTNPVDLTFKIYPKSSYNSSTP